MEKVERGMHPAIHPWHPGPTAAPWALAPTHVAISGTCLWCGASTYGTSLGCTGTLWVHSLCLKGFSLGVTAINPPKHVFNQNEHVSRSMERVDGASVSTAWSVLGFMNVN